MRLHVFKKDIFEMSFRQTTQVNGIAADRLYINILKVNAVNLWRTVIDLRRRIGVKFGVAVKAV